MVIVVAAAIIIIIIIIIIITEYLYNLCLSFKLNLYLKAFTTIYKLRCFRNT